MLVTDQFDKDLARTVSSFHIPDLRSKLQGEFTLETAQVLVNGSRREVWLRRPSCYPRRQLGGANWGISDQIRCGNNELVISHGLIDLKLRVGHSYFPFQSISRKSYNNGLNEMVTINHQSAQAKWYFAAMVIFASCCISLEPVAAQEEVRILAAEWYFDEPTFQEFLSDFANNTAVQPIVRTFDNEEKVIVMLEGNFWPGFELIFGTSDEFMRRLDSAGLLLGSALDGLMLGNDAIATDGDANWRGLGWIYTGGVSDSPAPEEVVVVKATRHRWFDWWEGVDAVAVPSGAANPDQATKFLQYLHDSGTGRAFLSSIYAHSAVSQKPVVFVTTEDDDDCDDNCDSMSPMLSCDPDGVAPIKSIPSLSYLTSDDGDDDCDCDSQNRRYFRSHPGEGLSGDPSYDYQNWFDSVRKSFPNALILVQSCDPD